MLAPEAAAAVTSPRMRLRIESRCSVYGAVVGAAMAFWIRAMRTRRGGRSSSGAALNLNA